MSALKDNPLVADYLSKLVLGDLQRFKNMAVAPLSTSVNHSPEYLTSKEALEKNLLTVTEVSLGGAVPQLKVTNGANVPVLFVDGEELIGAKQNRILNATILLKEKSDTTIPVSCTEQGRWSYRSRGFSHSNHIMAYKLRKLKSSSVAKRLAQSHAYQSDQGAVWNGVHAMMLSAKIASPTHAMHDVFQAKEPELGDYVGEFKLVPGQKGMLVFINGEVAGLDIVSLERAYRVLHPTLLRSYAMDALLESPGLTDEQPLDRATAFFGEASKCAESRYPSVGQGVDYRFEGSKVAGSALVADGKIIHLALYRC